MAPTTITPPEAELRLFAPSSIALGALLSSAWWCGGVSQSFVYGFWALATIVAMLRFVAQPLHRRALRGWLWVARLFGVVTSHLVMAAIYYGVVTPVGLAMKLGGRDILNRAIDRNARTYWTKVRRRSDATEYFRQY